MTAQTTGDSASAERRLSAMAAAGRILAASDSIEAAAPELLRSACEALEWDLGVLWRVDRGLDRLHRVGTWRRPTMVDEWIIRLDARPNLAKGEDVPGRVWASEASVVGPAAAAGTEGQGSVAAVPIVADGDVLAVLELHSGSPSASEPATDVLESIAGQVALFMRGHEARLGLQEASLRYRTLVKQIPAITYTDRVDADMSTLYISPQIESLLGISAEEYLADPGLWERHLHPEDRVRARDEYLKGRAAGEPFTYEYRMIARDGRMVWFRDEAVVLLGDDGMPSLVHGVMLDVTQRKQAEEQVAFLAFHDKLTGLPNRAMFEQLLEVAIAGAARHHLSLAVLSLDIDDFKLVNDGLGHEAGDELLRDVAARLRSATRETDLVARQGGDEFMMLLSDLERGEPVVGDPAEHAVAVASSVATRVHEALLSPFTLSETELFISASIGISVYPADASDGPALLKNADQAMFRSKRLGPGSSEVYSNEGSDSFGRLSFSTRLRKAVERQHWVLHYQPVVDLGSADMVGVEALIRWRDPAGGLIAPGEFIPLAEEMGLIEAIGDWTIRELSRQASAWRKEGLRMDTSFNLSPRQLWQPDLVRSIMEQLELADLDPGSVVVEIIESAAMIDPERTQRVLRQLSDRGLRLALDDFGTGYSSLARLKHMPVDILKIDRSFVRDIPGDEDACAMVRAVIQLAVGLGMTPVAEGIETEAQWAFLLESGCTLGQGFHFARPMPAAQVPGWRHEGEATLLALA
jgi:diguanylate cyclase (GGDEF)-like protein/PAS domain S-box-containing protein